MASQTQSHPISRPAHTELDLIYRQLMDIMCQELPVNTRTAETGATGSLTTAAAAH